MLVFHVMNLLLGAFFETELTGVDLEYVEQVQKTNVAMGLGVQELGVQGWESVFGGKNSLNVFARYLVHITKLPLHVF